MTKQTWTPEQIKALRQRTGLSEKAFAALIGIQFATINRWEKGWHSPVGTSVIALNRLRDQLDRYRAVQAKELEENNDA